MHESDLISVAVQRLLTSANGDWIASAIRNIPETFLSRGALTFAGTGTRNELIVHSLV